MTYNIISAVRDSFTNTALQVVSVKFNMFFIVLCETIDTYFQNLFNTRNHCAESVLLLLVVKYYLFFIQG